MTCFQRSRGVLIYSLPRAFELLNFPMASFFSSLWLYGSGKLGNIKKNDSLPRTPYYWQYKMSDFRSSPTLNKAVHDLLEQNIFLLPQMASNDLDLRRRWEQLRVVASEAKGRHGTDNEWVEPTPDYRNVIVTPKVRLRYKLSQNQHTWTTVSRC